MDYNDQVINVERGTLTPLILSTTGGWGRDATRFHSEERASVWTEGGGG